jgi:hypothetical protein
MGFRKHFATDPSIERTGVELDYGEGMVLKIARAGGANVAYQKTFTAVTASYKRAIEAETLPVEKGNELAREVFARSVLLDWEGVTMDDLNDDGDMTPAPCTVENKIKFFNALPEVFRDVQEQATRAMLFRRNIEEAELGNS